jgi:hypothetical protein
VYSIIKKLKNEKMKKTIIGLAIILSIASCKKVQPCNCGTVMSDRVSDYSVVIKNNCSGAERRFVLQPGDWMNAIVGEAYCITDVTSW